MSDRTMERASGFAAMGRPIPASELARLRALEAEREEAEATALRWCVHGLPRGFKAMREEVRAELLLFALYLYAKAQTDAVSSAKAERDQAVRTLDAEGVELMQDGDPMTLGDRIASNHAALCERAYQATERARALEVERDRYRSALEAVRADVLRETRLVHSQEFTSNGGRNG